MVAYQVTGAPDLVVVPSSAVYDAYSPHQYPWFCINYFVAMWFSALVVRALLFRTSSLHIDKAFTSLTEDKKRNTVTYVLQLVTTSMALVVQVIGSWEVLFLFQDSTSQTHLDWMVFALQSVAVLYTWELIYREKIGLPLLTHHLVTLLLIQLSTASFFDTQDLRYMRFAILLGFYATTEQTSFIALFCFRLDILQAWHGSLFFLATLQAFVMKTIVTVAAALYFFIVVTKAKRTAWKQFWTVCFLPLLILLYASQLYACKILWILRNRCICASSSNVSHSQVQRNGSETVCMTNETICASSSNASDSQVQGNGSKNVSITNETIEICFTNEAIKTQAKATPEISDHDDHNLSTEKSPTSSLDELEKGNDPPGGALGIAESKVSK